MNFEEDDDMLVNNYISSYTPMKPKKSLLPNLNKHNLPAEVIEGARLIRFQLTDKPERSKKIIDFYCLFMYYFNIGSAKDPRDVAKMINLNDSDINKAFLFFSEKNLIIHHPKEFVKSIVTDMNVHYEGVTEMIPNIKILCELIIENDDEMLDEYPQTVAGAIVYYYFERKNIYQRDKKLFFNSLGKSIQTLDKLKLRISQIVKKHNIEVK